MHLQALPGSVRGTNHNSFSENPVKKTFTAPAIRLESTLSALTLGAPVCSGNDCDPR